MLDDLFDAWRRFVRQSEQPIDIRPGSKVPSPVSPLRNDAQLIGRSRIGRLVEPRYRNVVDHADQLINKETVAPDGQLAVLGVIETAADFRDTGFQSLAIDI